MFFNVLSRDALNLPHLCPFHLGCLRKANNKVVVMFVFGQSPMTTRDVYKELGTFDLDALETPEIFDR